MKYALHSAAIVLATLATACGTSTDAVSPTDTSSSKTALPTLIGPTWRLVSIEGRPALAGVRVTAVFGADDRVSGVAGCNRYTGPATATGARLDLGALAMTRMHCGADGVMQQEDAYVTALEKVKAYRIAGTELQLRPAKGAATVVFKLE